MQKCTTANLLYNALNAFLNDNIVSFEISHHPYLICLTLPKHNQSEMDRECVHSKFLATIQ